MIGTHRSSTASLVVLLLLLGVAVLVVAVPVLVVGGSAALEEGGRLFDVSPYHVTIHPHSAVAKARVDIDLPIGHHIIGLRNVSSIHSSNSSIQEGSLTVFPGDGDRSCDVERTLWTTEDYSRNETYLQEQRDAATVLEAQIREHDSITDVMRDVLERLRHVDMQPKGGVVSTTPVPPQFVSPDEVMESLERMMVKRTKLLMDIQTRERTKVELQAQLTKLRGAAQAARHHERVAQVHLFVPKAGKVSLEVSYIIGQVSWTPHYTIRQDSKANQMNIHYQAVVRQDSPSSWTDISVELATGSPSTDRVVPTLAPINLYLTSPPVSQPPRHVVRGRSKRKATPSASRAYASMDASARVGMINEMDVAFDEDDLEQQFGGGGAEPYQESPSSLVNSVGVTEVFVLKGKHSIPPGQPIRLTITKLTLDSDLTYTAVPKQSSKVYVEGKVRNTSPFTLLPGPSVIYMDSSLGGTGALPLVGVNGNATIALGIDSSMLVMRKLISKTQDRSTWMLHTTRSHLLHYHLVVQSSKKSGVMVRVLDQVPLSTSPDISVHLHQPKAGKLPFPMPSTPSFPFPPTTTDATNVTLSQGGGIAWERFVGAHETLTIPMEFSMEYPDDGHIGGFDEV